MKKRLLALLLAIVIIVGLVVVAIPASAEQAVSTESTYKVGYAKLDVNPWIKDYPGAENMTDENGNAIGVPYDAAWTNSAYKDRVVTTTADGKTVGIIATRLAGAGTSANNYACGLLDDNGDGKVGYGDGLQVTATTVTDENGKTAVFITIDSIGGYLVMRNPIEKELITRTNGAIQANSIYVNGSHSHNAPDMENLNTAYNNEPNGPVGAYWTYYKSRVVDAVLAALNSAVPSVMSKGAVHALEESGYQLNFVRQYYSTDVYELENGENKNYIAGSNFGYKHREETKYNGDIYAADDSMHILQFTPVGGGKSTVLVNWRAHGTFIGGSNLLYSSDYIGSLRANMEAAGYNIAFLQGAGGNAVPEHLIKGNTPWKNDTSYEYTGADPTSDNSLKDALHYGYLLSRVALNCLQSDNMKTLKAGDIRYQNETFTFNYQQDAEDQKIVAAWWGALVEAYSKENGIAMGAASQALGFTNPTSADFGRTHKITIDNTKHGTDSEHDGMTAIFNSYYHLYNVYNRTNLYKDKTEGSITVGSIMLGDEVAMVVAGNELFDKYYGYDPETGTYDTTVNSWDTLVDTTTYGTPFVLAYTNGSHAYMPNVQSYTVNEGAPDVAPGIYESNTSNYASGTGEKLIVQFKTMLDDLNGSAVSGSTYYDTVAEAVEQVDEGSLITLNCEENAENLTIDRNLTIDFNGCTFTGEINVAKGKTLYCMDSATADFDVEGDEVNGYSGFTKIPKANIAGEGKVAGVPEGTNLIADGLQYVMIDDGANYSFHCVKLDTYAITVQAYNGNSENPSVYYTSDFAADEVVAAKVTQRGVALSIMEEPTAENFATKCLSTELMKDGEEFTAGVNNANSGNGTLLYNILNPNNAELVNRRNANTKVYGKAYMVVTDAEGNEEYLFGNPTNNTADNTKGYSLKDTIEAINKNWNSNSYTSSQKDNIVNMLFNYNAIVKSWNISNIRSHKIDDNSLNILVIGNSHGLDATRMLYHVFQAESDQDVIIANLYYSGCRIDQHASYLANNEPKYAYHKNGGADDSNGDEWTIQTGVTALTALQDEQWDIVVMQQMNNYAGMENWYNKAQFQFIMDYVKANQITTPQFAWHMTWANPDNYELYLNDDAAYGQEYITHVVGNNASWRNTHERNFAGADDKYDQDILYQKIIDCTKKYVLTSDYMGEDTMVLPSATAIQYALELCEDNHAMLYRDYTHLTNFGRLITAYLWYAKLTGTEELADIEIGEGYTLPAHLESTRQDSLHYPNVNHGDPIPVSLEMENTLKTAVNWALAHPYTVE